jgi:uncharacterized membrane protein
MALSLLNLFRGPWARRSNSMEDASSEPVPSTWDEEDPGGKGGGGGQSAAGGRGGAQRRRGKEQGRQPQ